VDRRDDAIVLVDRTLRVREYSPEAARTDALPGLVYFHGGGWVSGGLATHDAICATLANAAKCRIIAVEYRLAPESRFPAAHEDALAALDAIGADPARWAIDAARLGVGGDSAGGNLAAYAARRAKLRPALLFLLCPVLDALARSPSRERLANSYLIEEATMERYWEYYRAEGLSSDNPRIAPRRESDFSCLPRTHIHGAEYDPLRDEGESFAQSLSAAGVPVRHVVHAGLIHHFYGLGGVIPAAQAAFRAIGEDLREALWSE
jgi:acetyl esterase/lipase